MGVRRFATYAAASLLAVGLPVVPGHGAAARGPSCFGHQATIVGTARSEVIRGTAGPDVIVGGGGDDSIYGGGSADLICASSSATSNNRLYGGPGDDRIRGAAALWGGGGDDVLVVAGTVASAVTLVGGPGDDVLRAPVLKGVFTPGPGDDTVVGSTVPNDEVHFEHAGRGVVVDLATGVATGEGRDRVSNVGTVYGGAHADVLRGDAESNQLFGLGGDDTLQGKRGQDYLFGGPGADHLNGGVGTDWCDGGRHDRRASCEKRL